MSASPDTAVGLERELEWLAALIDTRIRLHFGQRCDHSDLHEIAPPQPTAGGSAYYAALVEKYSMTFDERAILILALAPHIRPQLLDPFLVRNPNLERGFTEFGGIVNASQGGFWPTAETAAFMLAGSNLERRFAIQALFDPEHFFRRDGILVMQDARPTESAFSTALGLGKEYLYRITTGHGYKPEFSSEFPAKRITTDQDWSDLVLPGQVLDEVEEIRATKIESCRAVATGTCYASSIASS